ncbi:MAG: hypothetical protein Unbinned5081contig1003_19 [Prokaryotic dsDNA virus sp.]|nr:MAG: hypothetical protein Unbinned5081contig1003_19 [Prokaryotic dsDNA virus sp.]|tara:strand:+ start:6313 stop:7179 length:867 start_codon:yes stop_codon:yes gene_type:complete
MILNNMNNTEWSTLNKLAESLGVNDCDLAEIAEIKLSSFRWSKSRNKSMDALGLMKIAENYDLNFIDFFFEGRIDFNCLKKSICLGQHSFQEKYNKYKTSKMTTLDNFLNSLKFTNFGLYERTRRRFQLPKNKTYEPNEDVSYNLISDVVEFVSKSKLIGKNELYRFGLESFLISESNQLVKTISTQPSIIRAYESLLLDNLSKLEKNCDYAIEKLTSRKCVISCKPKIERLQQEGKKKYLGNKYLNHYRTGILSSIPKLWGYTKVKGKLVQSGFDGDNTSRYEILYN